jgi:hypothetical protein
MSTLKCSTCKKTHPETMFISRQNNTLTKMCQNCRDRSNTTRVSSKVYETYKKLKDQMDKCSICDTAASHMEFDHLRDKTMRVEDCKTVVTMLAEREKCRILCLKCHRKITHIERTRKTTSEDKRTQNKYDRIWRNINFVNKYKTNLGGCQHPDCTDEFDPENLSFYEFDHVCWKGKKDAISNMAGSTYSIKTIEEELDKCVMLCGYCHRDKTKIQWLERRKEFGESESPTEKTKKRTIRKFTMDQVREIRAMYPEKNTVVLSEEYMVTTGCISDILSNRSYNDPEYTPVSGFKKVIRESCDGTIETYDSVNIASSSNSMPTYQIATACRGFKTIGGFKWSYKKTLA